MRKEALLLLVLTIGALTSVGLAADNLMLTGKPVEWQSWGEEPKVPSPSAAGGEALETPNQRRHRLGLPIEASFPASDVGVVEETPNQQRHRLELLAKAP